MGISIGHLFSEALASGENLHDGVQLEVDHGHWVRQGPALNQESSAAGMDLGQIGM